MDKFVTKKPRLAVPGTSESEIKSPKQTNVRVFSAPAVHATSLGLDNETETNVLPNDISAFLNKSIKDLDKVEILKNIWVPSRDYAFPVLSVKGRHLKFQYNWLERFKWLAYSKAKNGAFCKYCVIFSKKEAGKGNYELIGMYL